VLKNNFLSRSFVIIAALFLPLCLNARQNNRITSRHILDLQIQLPEPVFSDDGTSTYFTVVQRSFYVISEDTVSSALSLNAFKQFNVKGRPFAVIDVPILEKNTDFPLASAPELTCKQSIAGMIKGKTVYRLDISYIPAINTRGKQAIPVSILVRLEGRNIKLVKAAEINSITHDDLIENNDEMMGLSKVFSGNNQKRLKIIIKEEGLVRLDKSLLKTAGFTTSSVDPAYFRLTTQGRELPLFISGGQDGSFDKDDYLEFFVDKLWHYKSSDEKQLDIYTEDNIYWLDVSDSPGLRFGQEESTEGKVDWSQKKYPRSTNHKVHIEQNNYFHRLPYARNVTDSDHWFYTNPIIGGKKREIQFKLKNPDEFSINKFRVKLKMQGLSRSQEINRIDVFVNQNHVASGLWQGNMTLNLVSEPITSSCLLDGDNILTVVNHSEEGPLAQLLLDWFELDYPRLLLAADDYLEFSAPAGGLGKVGHFELEGFTDPDINIFKYPGIKIMLPEVKSVTDTSGNITYTAVFEDRIFNADIKYIAKTTAAIILPDTLELVEPSDLAQRSKGADYIVIVPSDSLGEDILEPLIKLRDSQGYKTVIADLKTIYNEFNFGIANPHGIRNYLKFIYKNKSSDYQYVLLVGDGRINNLQSSKQGHEIPTHIYQTVKYGAAVSDHWYAALQGDDAIPEIAIGRLPVSSIKQLELVIKKIVDYENSPPESWKNEYLLIGSGGHNDVFYNQSEVLIKSVMSHALHPNRLYLAGSINDPNVGGTEDLLRHLRKGCALVNFRGHGGGAIWADGGLLDLDDIELLENRKRLPIITSMTCFTGDFASGRTCLGEALLNQNEAGTVAFWGSTGLGWVYNDYALLTRLYELIREKPYLPIGALIMDAKKAFLRHNFGDLPETDVYQYTLLGDPATRLAIPAKPISAEIVSPSVNAGDSLKFKIQAETTGIKGQVEIFNPALETIKTKTFSTTSNTISGFIKIPSDYSHKDGGLRFNFWNADAPDHRNGYLNFSCNNAFFDSLTISPPKPLHTDSISISAEIDDVAGFDHVWCNIISPEADSIQMILNNGKWKTVKKIGPYPAGIRVNYCLGVNNTEGRVTKSDTVFFTIQSKPDFFVTRVSCGGKNTSGFTAEIYNNSPAVLFDVPVKFTVDNSGFTGYDTVKIQPFAKTMAFIAFVPNMSVYHVAVTANPDSSIAESNFANNHRSEDITANVFQVTPEFGSMNHQLQNDTVGVRNTITALIPAGSVTAKSAINFTQREIPGTGKVWDITLPGLGDKDALAKPMQLFFYDTTSTRKPYLFDQTTNRWIALQLIKQTNKFIHCQTVSPGLFRLMEFDDKQPPEIDIQVKDQAFTDGSYIPEKPEILVNIKDISGVDTRASSLHIFLDGKQELPETWSIPDSLADRTQCVVNYQPLLTVGTHSIQVNASDIHGNSLLSDEIQFTVGGGLEIKYLGNHPNPFRVETIFAYILTAGTKKTSLKIYTVAGKLIRTFQTIEMGSADYHEVYWDGCDQWGEDAANGVYFFRLQAVGEKHIREFTGKIAKLR